MHSTNITYISDTSMKCDFTGGKRCGFATDRSLGVFTWEPSRGHIHDGIYFDHTSPDDHRGNFNFNYNNLLDN